MKRFNRCRGLLSLFLLLFLLGVFSFLSATTTEACGFKDNQFDIADCQDVGAWQDLEVLLADPNTLIASYTRPGEKDSCKDGDRGDHWKETVVGHHAREKDDEGDGKERWKKSYDKNHKYGAKCNGTETILSPLSVAQTNTASTSTTGVTLTGTSKQRADAIAVTTLTGYKAGKKTKSVINESDLAAGSTATASNSVTGASLFDTSNLEASARAEATATGIGDSCTDCLNDLTNNGTVTVSATATARMPEIGLDAVNGASGTSTITATSTATGLAGGKKSETVTNNGTITVTSSATADMSNIGLSLVDAASAATSMNPGAFATGISGGDGDDVFSNAGVLSASATASVPDADNIRLLNLADASIADASMKAEAVATGMDGGKGADTIKNEATGGVTAFARAEGDSTQVEVNVVDFASGDVTTLLDATATGLAGGEGDDSISSAGAVVATAETEANLTSVNVSLFDMTFVGNIADRLADPPAAAASHWRSSAVGIDGGQGRDIVWSGLGLTATATSKLTSNNVSVGSEGITASIIDLFAEGDLASADLLAETEAIGLSGGADRDLVVNFGFLTALADSDAFQWSANVGLSTIDVKIPTPGLTIGSAGTGALAIATGLDGGDGDDLMVNGGAVSVTADANAQAYTGTAVLQGIFSETDTFGIGVAISDTETEATSRATGIGGGKGKDTILNTNLLNVRALTDTGTGGVTLNIMPRTEGIFSLGIALTDTSTLGDATAVGIEGGAQDDRIGNSSTVTADAESDVLAWSGSLDLGAKDTSTVVLGAAAARAESIANSHSTGIDAGEGHDLVLNTGTADVDAHSSATGVSVAAEIQGMTKGGDAPDDGGGTGGGSTYLTAGVSLTDATTTSEADATGIDLGDGHDRLLNTGNVDSYGLAETTSVAVSLTVQGDVEHLSVGGAVSDTTANSTASSSGISGGKGHDRIVNAETGKLWSHARADSTAVSVSANVQITEKAAFLGGALSFAGTEAESTAFGIDGGAGHDEILMCGMMDAWAESFADTVGVSLGVQGVAKGAGLQAVLSDTSAKAISDSVGISGGEGPEGKDVIYNGGTVSARARSEADATAVSLGVTIAKQGLAAGAALSKSSGTAEAGATGIDGGAGQSTIVSDNAVTAVSVAEADALSIGVTIAGTAKGVALGAALTDASAEATADSAGIRGGKGDDDVKSSGTVTSAATSDIDVVAVSTSVSVAKGGVAAGAALSDSSAKALSTSAGIDGGEGMDRIESDGSINAGAETFIDATAVSVTIAGSMTGLSAGAALSDSSANGTAIATGIAGGDGRDEIQSSGTILSHSKTDLNATSVSANISVAKEGAAIGAALSDTSATALSIATGLDGGAGKDRIEAAAESSVNVTTEAYADAVSVSVSVNGALYGAAAGAALADSSATAIGDATGISGGLDKDVIRNDSAVTTLSWADTDATTVSVTASGSVGLAAGASLADSSAVSLSNTTGIDGGSGDDRIENNGVLNAGSSASADATSVSVQLSLGIVAAGAALTDSSATVISSAKGIDGGSGRDDIFNTSQITANSHTDGDATSVSVNIPVGGVPLGAAFGDASTQSIAKVDGIDGGSEDDRIVNDGTINGMAHSELDASSTAINIGIGWASAEATVASQTELRGIAGGTGDDEIINNGLIWLRPDTNRSPYMANLTAKTFALTLAGATEAESELTARTRSTGIDGGEGDDWIESKTITLLTNAHLSSSSTSIGIFGKADAGGTSRAETYGTAIEGGIGDDRTFNRGRIEVVSDSAMSMNATSFTVAGVADSSGTLGARTWATGVSGGEGRDRLENLGENPETNGIFALATSTLSSTGKSTAIFGSAEAGAAAVSETLAIGMDGGTGEDRLDNGTTVSANAVSNTTSNRSSFVFAGSASTDSVLRSFGTAKGLSGGLGDDELFNAAEGTILAGVNSSLTASGGTSATFGDTETSGLATADAFAAGIDGGSGNDRIGNDGAITVTARTNAVSTNSSDAGIFFYDAGTVSEAGSTIHAYGIISDAGTAPEEPGKVCKASGAPPLIIEEEEKKKKSEEREEKKEEEYDRKEEEGKRKEHDEEKKHEKDEDERHEEKEKRKEKDNRHKFTGNVIENAGVITVTIDALQNVPTARSRSDAEGGDWAWFTGGDAEATATTTIDATAAGISVAGGRSRILNSGSITVTNSPYAEAVTDPNGGAVSTDGDGYGTSIATIVSHGAGIEAGDGENRIGHTGTISVTARPNAVVVVDADGGTTGDADAFGTASSESVVSGIEAGDGKNDIEIGETAAITVEAAPQAWADANSDGSGADGDGRAGCDNQESDCDVDRPFTAKVKADAAAVRTGDGGNFVRNDGTLTSRIFSHAKVTTITDADIGGDSVAVGLGRADAAIYGIRSGDGDDFLSNVGTITVIGNPSVFVKPNSTGGGDITNLDATSQGYALIDLAGAGIDAGAGANKVCSQGTISVSSDTVGTISMTVNGQGTDGDGRGGWSADPTKATVSSWLAGIKTGAGDDLVVNGGEIMVSAVATASVTAGVDGDDFADADGFVEGLVKATGVGVWSDGGLDRILNEGTIDVAATPTGSVSTSLSRDLCCGENTGRAKLTAEAKATGIRTGDEDATVKNLGAIEATARPMNLSAWVSGDGEPSRFIYAPAEAVGIETGAGADRIENVGEITVMAYDGFPENYSCSNWGHAYTCSYDVTATGIRSRGGNDRITNSGRITAAVVRGGVTAAGTAIDTGDGNDEVVLEAGSVVEGDIDLGADDDSLTVIQDASITGDVTGNVGTDALVLRDVGNFNHPVDDWEFESIIKEGSTITTLSGMTMTRVESLTVKGGTLRVEGNYSLSPESLTVARVHGDGSCGKFEVKGAVELNGRLRVEAGAGAFRNGTRYEVLTGEAVTGVFSGIELPKKTRLLDFELQSEGGARQVRVSAASFRSVAKNPAERAVGAHLDRLLPSVEGGLSDTLGAFQQLETNGDFERAFSSLSPASHDHYTRIAQDLADGHVRNLSRRISSLRTKEYIVRGDHGPRDGTGQPVLLAYEGTDFHLVLPERSRRYGEEENSIWVDLPAQYGKQSDRGDGFAGYSYTSTGLLFGTDRKLGRNLLGGAGISYADSDAEIGAATGSGRVESLLGSVYGSWFAGRSYLDLSLTYGQQRYESERGVAVGADASLAGSRHAGDTFVTHLKSGRDFLLGLWEIGPSLGLQYTYLYEEGFGETGAGDVSLILEDRSTNALVGSAGIRVARVFDLSAGDLVPEIGLGWNQDFGIDDRTLVAAFSGAPDVNFSVPGQDASQTGASIDTGLTFLNRRGLITSVHYNAELRDAYTTQGITGRVRYEF